VTKEEQPDDKELLRLKALSAKTGLSLDTLRLLKAKESAIMQSKSIMNRSMTLEDNQKKI